MGTPESMGNIHQAVHFVVYVLKMQELSAVHS